jgi:hypothetical protein
MRIFASLGLLAFLTVAVFGAPLFCSQPVKEIELPCKPPLSLLRWWDLDYVAREEKPATIHARYTFQGETIATRQELGQLNPGNEPWVAWRGPGKHGLQVRVIVPAGLEPAEYRRWQAWVEECEGRPVEFVEVSPTGPTVPSRLD